MAAVLLPAANLWSAARIESWWAYGLVAVSLAIAADNALAFWRRLRLIDRSIA